ncbi:MAG TPA: SsrA-binding protein SmpB [Candidatus Azoamicus sp. OHIO1]
MNTLENSVVCINKRISYDYLIKSRYEAGVVLEGWEVKSTKCGNIQISGSYIIMSDLNLWVIGSHISAMSSVCTHGIILENRKRKLLMRKKELKKLDDILKYTNCTLVPYKVYTKNNIIKLEICLCIGKKKYDKRLELKNFEWNTEKNRKIRSIIKS